MSDYNGRLAWDPDSGFHLAENGEPVVTEDGGKTWRYAQAGDVSHFDRYHERFAVVDTTVNGLARGEAEGNEHDAAPLPDDAHFDGLKQSPDGLAVKETSHTEAWA